MSGPIVRKYGFPNFEKIFGAREVEHGVDENGPKTPDAAAGPAATEKKTKKPAAAKSKSRKS